MRTGVNVWKYEGVRFFRIWSLIEYRGGERDEV